MGRHGCACTTYEREEGCRCSCHRHTLAQDVQGLQDAVQTLRYAVIRYYVVEVQPHVRRWVARTPRDTPPVPTYPHAYAHLSLIGRLRIAWRLIRHNSTP